MRCLNIIALILNTVAAVLLVFWPPQVSVYTEEGALVGPWAGPLTPEGKKKGTTQKLLRRLGPCLLAAEFFLQLIATAFG